MLPDANTGTDTDIDYRNEVADPNATAYKDDESNDKLSSPHTACNNSSLSNNLICQWMLCWRKDWSTCLLGFFTTVLGNLSTMGNQGHASSLTLWGNILASCGSILYGLNDAFAGKLVKEYDRKKVCS